jgi:hypothetical protein
MASEDLGDLRTHEDAKGWLEAIGRAVVTRGLGNREATAGIRAVEAWLKAEGERATMQVVEELRAEVARLKVDTSAGRSNTGTEIGRRRTPWRRLPGFARGCRTSDWAR